MKRTAAGILLFTFLAIPLIATFTYLHCHKKQVRKEVKRRMEKGIDRKDLTLLVFAGEETHTLLRWEHDREFEYRGEMYDVVEKEIRGDSIWYWCWMDHEETELNRKLDELVSNVLGNDPLKKEKTNRLVKFYNSLFFLPCHEETNIPAIAELISPPYTNAYRAVYRSPTVPPPKSC